MELSIILRPILSLLRYLSFYIVRLCLKCCGISRKSSSHSTSHLLSSGTRVYRRHLLYVSMTNIDNILKIYRNGLPRVAQASGRRRIKNIKLFLCDRRVKYFVEPVVQVRRVIFTAFLSTLEVHDDLATQGAQEVNSFCVAEFGEVFPIHCQNYISSFYLNKEITGHPLGNSFQERESDI